MGANFRQPPNAGAEAVIVSKNITANGTYNASSDSADGYNPVTVNVPDKRINMTNLQTFIDNDIQNVDYITNVIDDVLGMAVFFNDDHGTYLSLLDGGATLTLYEKLSSDGEYIEVPSTDYHIEWYGTGRGNYYYIVTYNPNKYIYQLKLNIFNAYRVNGRALTGYIAT